MHPRNKHKHGYNFDLLVQHTPQLKAHLITTVTGTVSIDFANPLSVKLLNQSLLRCHYGIEFWELPESFLCPPIPGRVDYIHAIADLLASGDKIPTGKHIRGLDIGCGANLVYPILGCSEYQWAFTASDINKVALKCAKTIVEFNKLNISLRLQKSDNHKFQSIIKQNEYFHFTMCNPPFHSSHTEALKGTKRKWQNLKKIKKTSLNFSGHAPELWCEGGELKFINDMITESKTFSQQCGWFTSLVSKKDNLPKLKAKLQSINVDQIKIVNMSQGQKQSRFIAWSFLTTQERNARST